MCLLSCWPGSMPGPRGLRRRARCGGWTGADAAAVDGVVGAWLAEQAGLGDPATQPGEQALVAVAVDGKTVRGAVSAEGNQVHLLAAATHELAGPRNARRRATPHDLAPGATVR